MKNFNINSLNNVFSKFLILTILILIGYSCEKEKDQLTEFDFQTTKLVYYPDKQITMTFNIVPKGNPDNYSVKWYDPDSLEDRGPYTIKFSNDIILDYEVSVNGNQIQRFQYKIKTDTIDSLKYDYRNDYIGMYSCNVASLYDGLARYQIDTLTVVKNNSFKMVNIMTKNDIINNYEGDKMIYLNSNGSYSHPACNFFGYHSGVLFANDSIHYTVSGPLGNYYTNNYEGVKINQ